ncbi:MAG: hypothetical protein ACE5G8_00525, partial [Anaerolineae bacterium]
MTNDSSQLYHNRIFVILAILSAAGLIVTARLVRWQILEHTHFVELANQQHQKEIELKATRGKIFDADNHLLAVDTIQYEVSASPQLISDPQQTTDRLYRLLNIPRDTLLQELTSDHPWVLLTRTAPADVGRTLLEW